MRLSIVSLCVALCAGLLVTPAAHAADTVTPSTPSAFDEPRADGVLMSYVVNAASTRRRDLRATEQAIAATGGVIVQPWPEIGVYIVHSTDGGFADSVHARGAGAVLSAGPTRTVAVAEGTPSTASGWDTVPVRRPPANGDRGAPPTPFTGTPDPLESVQWDHQAINADQAHAISDGSANVLVGILDSGIDDQHVDLAANFEPTTSVNCANAGRPDTTPHAWRPVGNPHGNQVAGIVAADRNGVGTVGVAPGVRIASVRVSRQDDRIYPEYAICGYMWAGGWNMDISNASFTVDPMGVFCDDQPYQATVNLAVRRAITWSHSRGVLHVAGAGNEGSDFDTTFVYPGSPSDATRTARTVNETCAELPAQADNVVAVGAIGPNLYRAPFSNFGLSLVDVAAPGVQIPTTGNSTWTAFTGTSAATPEAAGVAALLKSTHPRAGPDRLRDLLFAQAIGNPCACTADEARSKLEGFGRVDALAAVQRARGSGHHRPGNHPRPR
ncbi:MAG: S8 family serine peptidase [Actinomycetales bacterium]